VVHWSSLLCLVVSLFCSTLAPDAAPAAAAPAAPAAPAAAPAGAPAVVSAGPAMPPDATDALDADADDPAAATDASDANARVAAAPAASDADAPSAAPGADVPADAPIADATDHTPAAASDAASQDAASQDAASQDAASQGDLPEPRPPLTQPVMPNQCQDISRWRAHAAHCRSKLGCYHGFRLEWAVGDGSRASSGHKDILVRCLVCNTTSKPGGGNAGPSIDNFLSGHVGFHLVHGWAKFPNKGEEHRLKSGDPAAISTLAPKEMKKRPAPAADAGDVASEAAATGDAAAAGDAAAGDASATGGAAASDVAASGAATSDAAASGDAASDAAASAIGGDLRVRFEAFRTSEWTSEYSPHEADGVVMCTRCGFERIDMSNFAWKTNCAKHTAACRKKNIVRTADGEKRAPPKQRRIVDFHGGDQQHQQKLR
jgi:hypothetical protein